MEEEGREIGMLYVHLHFGTFIVTSGQLFSNFSHLPPSDLIGCLLSPRPFCFSFFFFFFFSKRIVSVAERERLYKNE